MLIRNSCDSHGTFCTHQCLDIVGWLQESTGLLYGTQKVSQINHHLAAEVLQLSK